MRDVRERGVGVKLLVGWGCWVVGGWWNLGVWCGGGVVGGGDCSDCSSSK